MQKFLVLWLMLPQLGSKVSCAFPFENELPRIAEMQPPKRWLVFMEIRLWRCVGLAPPAQLSLGNLLDFLRCSTHIQPKKRCYHIKHYHMYLAIDGNAVDLIASYSLHGQHVQHHCLLKEKGALIPLMKISIHKMFALNLTVTNFYSKEKVYWQPMDGNCEGFFMIFSLLYNNCTNLYCGKRFPWSIYTRSNNIELKLSHASDPKRADIGVLVNLVDRHFVYSHCGTHGGGLIEWGDFEIRTYRIRTEMLNRLRISVESNSSKGSNILLYNGPSSMMPRLIAHKDRFYKALFKSSTFQVFVVSIISKKSEDFRLIYRSDQMVVSNVVTVTQRIQVQNNTGCGNSNTNSWMCTLVIVSPRSTHARLRILHMDFNGPFSDMFVSSGIAVYNVMKNNSNLVAHFYSNRWFLRRSLTITGTENRLFVSVYAYSPFALLSCSFIAESSPCVGRFIGWHIRPSITMMPHEVHTVRNRYITNVEIDINYQCVAIHIIFTPNEYIPRCYVVNIIFDYPNMLSVHAYRESFPSRYERYCHISVPYGDFSYTHNEVRSFKAVGIFKKIKLKTDECGNRPFTIITASHISCMYPCRDLYRTTHVETPDKLKCDICAYKWLDNLQNTHCYLISSNDTVVLERIKGTLPPTISLSTPISRGLFGHLISYSVSKFLHQFHEDRLMGIRLNGGELWRVRRNSLVLLGRGQVMSVWTSPPSIHTKIIFHRGCYQYSIYELVIGTVSAAYAMCGRRGARVLTIDDNQELHFVLEYIMKPLKMERVLIGMKHKVWRQG